MDASGRRSGFTELGYQTYCFLYLLHFTLIDVYCYCAIVSYLLYRTSVLLNLLSRTLGKTSIQRVLEFQFG
jgi:hypothetical protein